MGKVTSQALGSILLPFYLFMSLFLSFFSLPFAGTNIYSSGSPQIPTLGLSQDHKGVEGSPWTHAGHDSSNIEDEKPFFYLSLHSPDGSEQHTRFSLILSSPYLWPNVVLNITLPSPDLASKNRTQPVTPKISLRSFTQLCQLY